MPKNRQTLPASVLNVVVSQRVVEDSRSNERRDVLDQAWTILLANIGAVCIPVPNGLTDVSAFLKAVSPNAVVLSGGGNLSPDMRRRDGTAAAITPGLKDVAPERDATEGCLLRAAESKGWPVLGVCRGMQALVTYHGGRLTMLNGHAGTRHALYHVATDSAPEPAGEREVNSFHDLGVMPEGLPTAMDALAYAPDGSIEAVSHRALPHFGIMWHPERERPHAAADLSTLDQLLRFGTLS